MSTFRVGFCDAHVSVIAAIRAVPFELACPCTRVVGTEWNPVTSVVVIRETRAQPVRRRHGKDKNGPASG